MDQKNGWVWFWSMCTKTAQKLSKIVILRNLLRKSNINRKPFIWSHFNIITKFGPKNFVSLVLSNVYKNCLKIKENVIFFETYFEKSNINLKPLIWFKYKIITKFGQKQWASLVFGKVYEKHRKIKKKCYFKKPSWKRVIWTINHLFGPMIWLKWNLDKKKGVCYFGQSVRKLHENYGIVLFYETYSEVGIISQNPLVWSHYKIVTKFRPKKWVSFVLEKVYENCPKIKKKCYFTKPNSKWVISTGNHLFGPIKR